jgi:hypothetical protein
MSTLHPLESFLVLVPFARISCTKVVRDMVLELPITVRRVHSASARRIYLISQSGLDPRQLSS